MGGGAADAADFFLGGDVAAGGGANFTGSWSSSLLLASTCFLKKEGRKEGRKEGAWVVATAVHRH